MSIDLSNSYDSASSRLSSFKTYIEVSKAEKKAKRDAANSTSKSVANTATQLNKIETQQKRFLRNPPNSFDQLLNLISLVKGSGTDTTDFLRKRLLETAVKIEPEVKKIISDQAIKALGCSQEQTFNGYSQKKLNLGVKSLGEAQGIYVPVQSLDIINLLKEMPNDVTGKIRYEKPIPSAQQNLFKPYGGKVPFPMNKEMNLRMENSNLNRSFYQESGKYYQGTSGLDLFDFVYSTTNQYGHNQPSYRVALINKPTNTLTISGVTSPGKSLNKVGEFLQDYYSTIKLIDSVNIAETLVNVISGAISIKSNLSAQEIEQGTKFSLIIQRILGLCFDSRREIDVSGISKVAELDGVDDSFFDLTEVDLRNIDIKISNIQNGVMEFEDCNNVKLPVDYETIVNELDKFRDMEENQTLDEQVNSITNILDTIYQNPEWKAFLPTNFNLEVAVNKEIVKQIPLAVASIVLSPKVLFPIFTLLQVIESQAKNTYNKAITSGNTIVQSGNTTLGGVNNIINNSTDFLKVFKSFNIQVMSKIGAIFLKTLYEILKKDIINLISSVILDVSKSQRLKKYTIILRLVNILLIIAQLVNDFRKCKSLITDILLLLKTIFGKPSGSIPLPLLLLTQFLPGTSPERSTINTIVLLQKVGIPTGVLPDGSPNLMGIYNLMTHKGADKEHAENSKGEGVVIVPPVTGGVLRVYVKNT